MQSHLKQPGSSVTGGTFSVRCATRHLQAALQSDRAAALLVAVVYDLRELGTFQVHEFVVMPEHFHLLITVRPGTTIESAVQMIKQEFVSRAENQLGLLSPVWQEGFSEARLDGLHSFSEARQYIQSNPVARGLVVDAGQYPFSSANGSFELDPLPLKLRTTPDRGPLRRVMNADIA